MIILKRMAALCLSLAVILTAFPMTGFAQSATLDILRVNGDQTSVRVLDGDQVVLALTSIPGDWQGKAITWVGAQLSGLTCDAHQPPQLTCTVSNSASGTHNTYQIRAQVLTASGYQLSNIVSLDVWARAATPVTSSPPVMLGGVNDQWGCWSFSDLKAGSYHNPYGSLLGEFEYIVFGKRGFTNIKVLDVTSVCRNAANGDTVTSMTVQHSPTTNPQVQVVYMQQPNGGAYTVLSDVGAPSCPASAAFELNSVGQVSCRYPNGTSQSMGNMDYINDLTLLTSTYNSLSTVIPSTTTAPQNSLTIPSGGFKALSTPHDSYTTQDDQNTLRIDRTWGDRLFLRLERALLPDVLRNVPVRWEVSKLSNLASCDNDKALDLLTCSITSDKSVVGMIAGRAVLTLNGVDYPTRNFVTVIPTAGSSIPAPARTAFSQRCTAVPWNTNGEERGYYEDQLKEWTFALVDSENGYKPSSFCKASGGWIVTEKDVNGPKSNVNVRESNQEKIWLTKGDHDMQLNLQAYNMNKSERSVPSGFVLPKRPGAELGDFATRCVTRAIWDVKGSGIVWDQYKTGQWPEWTFMLVNAKTLQPSADCIADGWILTDVRNADAAQTNEVRTVRGSDRIAIYKTTNKVDLYLWAVKYSPDAPLRKDGSRAYLTQHPHSIGLPAFESSMVLTDEGVNLKDCKIYTFYGLDDDFMIELQHGKTGERHPSCSAKYFKVNGNPGVYSNFRQINSQEARIKRGDGGIVGINAVYDNQFVATTVYVEKANGVPEVQENSPFPTVDQLEKTFKFTARTIGGKARLDWTDALSANDGYYALSYSRYDAKSGAYEGGAVDIYTNDTTYSFAVEKEKKYVINLEIHRTGGLLVFTRSTTLMTTSNTPTVVPPTTSGSVPPAGYEYPIEEIPTTDVVFGDINMNTLAGKAAQFLGLTGISGGRPPKCNGCKPDFDGNANLNKAEFTKFSLLFLFGPHSFEDPMPQMQNPSSPMDTVSTWYGRLIGHPYSFDDPMPQMQNPVVTPPDADPQSWYWIFMKKAMEIGMIKGNPNGTISPGQGINTATAMTIIRRMLGDKYQVGIGYRGVWKDVNGSDWFAEGAQMAYDFNLLPHRKDSGQFRANDVLTRYETAVLFYNLAVALR